VNNIAAKHDSSVNKENCNTTHKSRYDFFNCSFGKAFVDDFQPPECQKNSKLTNNELG